MHHLTSHVRTSLYSSLSFVHTFQQAYPVMSVIAFAVVFSVGYGLSVMMFHPDARLSKGSRKSALRGELKGIEL